MSCELVDLNRSLYYYHQKKPRLLEDSSLLQKIIELRQKHKTLGAKKLAKLLSSSGKVVNHKRVARLLRENDLRSSRHRRTRRETPNLIRLPIPIAIRELNQVWSIDFMVARKRNSFKFMLLNCMDIKSRVSPVMSIERSFTSIDVTDELEKSMKKYGRPQGIITDNGTEFVAYHFRAWCKRNKITHYLTQKNSPAQNCYIESFNSCVRREVLDSNDFNSISELRKKVDEWRTFYNNQRPHGSLDYASPLEYLHQQNIN